MAQSFNCSEDSAHDLSLFPVGSGSWLELDSAFRQESEHPAF